MTTAALAIDFIDIDVRNLPILWEDIFRQAVNDYVGNDETSAMYKNAEQWLFHEEYNPELDGWDFQDVCSFHVVSEAFQLNIEKARFDIQCMRDWNYECNGTTKGRKTGFVCKKEIGFLIKKWHKLT